jgi:trafficking protein particle complex subunit 9
MSTDEFFYCAPSRVKVLVVPIGEVRTSYFSRCVQLLRENGVIPFRNMDLSRFSKAMFNPAVFPPGQVVFEFLTNWESQYAYLEDFQHWRKLFAVIRSILPSTDRGIDRWS